MRRSGVGLEVTDCGERSSERRVVCREDEEEVASDLVPDDLVSLCDGGDGLLRGVSIKPVLQQRARYQ